MLSDFPVIASLKSKLKWHQQRQGVLAENVANADTPGFRAQELKAPDFGSNARVAALGVARTDAQHIVPANQSAEFGVDRKIDGWEVTPEGNGVVLEEQMMKVAQNQMDYQLATSLYSRAMSLLRIAATGQR